MNKIEVIDAKAIGFISNWCKNIPVSISLVNSRKSKLGDYRMQDGQHYITVNRDLPSATLFFVLTHEIAHMFCRIKYKHKIKPHGIEWKKQFGVLILESLNYYPLAYHVFLQKFLINPKATFNTHKSFLDYQPCILQEGMVPLKALPLGSHFTFNGKRYVKGSIRKIRYICTDHTSGRDYTIHGLVLVLPLED